MFNLFLLCRKDEISFDIVAVCGNKGECCFDNVAGVDGAYRLRYCRPRSNVCERGVLFCFSAVLDPRVGHTMDVLSP